MNVNIGEPGGISAVTVIHVVPKQMKYYSDVRRMNEYWCIMFYTLLDRIFICNGVNWIRRRYERVCFL